MKIAVAGGTGLVGRLVVADARSRGHDVTVVSRAEGTDLVTGDGLVEALAGCAVVVDVSNSSGTSKTKSVAFFTAATKNLLAAGAEAGVGHHVVLSIVGIDRVPFGYYEGKRRQERLVADSRLPWTVLRATQFHEFPAQLLTRMRGPFLAVPRMESATIAAREVAEHLVDLAVAVRRATSSVRRSDSSRNATVSSSNPTACRPGVRSATRATVRASAGSFLRPCPIEKIRARVASFAGTSITDSPSLSSRWARYAPTPVAPSTAHRRSGHCRPNASSCRYPLLSFTTCTQASSRSRSSITDTACDRFAGSTPSTTATITNSIQTKGRRCRADLPRAKQTPLEPHHRRLRR